MVSEEGGWSWLCVWTLEPQTRQAEHLLFDLDIKPEDGITIYRFLEVVDPPLSHLTQPEFRVSSHRMY